MLYIIWCTLNMPCVTVCVFCTMNSDEDVIKGGSVINGAAARPLFVPEDFTSSFTI